MMDANTMLVSMKQTSMMSNFYGAMVHVYMMHLQLGTDRRKANFLKKDFQNQNFRTIYDEEICWLEQDYDVEKRR